MTYLLLTKPNRLLYFYMYFEIAKLFSFSLSKNHIIFWNQLKLIVLDYCISLHYWKQSRFIIEHIYQTIKQYKHRIYLFRVISLHYSNWQKWKYSMDLNTSLQSYIPCLSKLTTQKRKSIRELTISKCNSMIFFNKL